MEFPDFDITSTEPISRAFLDRGITSFYTASAFIHKLPYGRNHDRNDQFTVFTDMRGTCSTKHALLKRLVDENHVRGFELMLGIFRITGSNTPPVAATLNTYHLDHIPEAHTYLRYGDQILDYTTVPSIEFADDLIVEIEISPEEITDFKIAYHKTYFEEWLARESTIPYSIEELWSIREECIAALSSGSREK